MREEIAGLDYQNAALKDELVLVREERARMGELAGKGLIETTKLNSADRELARMMGSEGEIAASIARAQARISEIELQVLAIDQTGGKEALRELRTVDARLAELRDRLTEVDARQARTVIRSPVSGTVNEVASGLVPHAIAMIVSKHWRSSQSCTLPKAERQPQLR
ncbi:hypothetical protein ASD83_11090 [Devosia sp. Root685]|uniref:hypothetical protein n=1 Tax=Devosia sp. Root685 TaxID=1736587 RepID=UPI0006F79BEE|nr:hypothetical protein [Devosia sp. Root685]KRA97646.1 hypothetical protein ASD83_11090 [Devosia sp. Root685]